MMPLPVTAISGASIVVEDMAKRFGERVAVEGLSFEVKPGEVFGLLGPNGAGKTTTVRMLTGLLQPSHGRGSVCGVALPVSDEGSTLRKRIGLLTEQPGLYDRLSAKENFQFFIRLHELDETRALSLADKYLDRFGLKGRAHEPVGGFSKGMRQKLAIVRTLLHEPQVIFLDEPTSGLDPQSAKTVRDAIAELAKEGRTLVLCSHNLAEVERLCDRVAIIKNRLRTVAQVRELRREGASLEIHLEADGEQYRPVLNALPFQPTVLSEGRVLRVSFDDATHGPDVIAALVTAGARVQTAVRASRPLEEAYLELVRDEGDL